MNKKMIISNNYFKINFLFLLFLIILLLLLLFIYLYKKKTIESFFNAERYILEDCTDNWAKDFNKGIKECKKASWVTDPKYLCAICDSNINKNISMLKTKNKIYFGCDNENASNSYGLQWKKHKKLGNYTKLGNFVTDLLTCNTFNVDVTSGMYIFLCCDDYASFTINGQTTYKNEGFNFMGMYYVENVKYGDVVNLLFQNVCDPGGFNISYIWNKQLFIMDENGYENVANIINYTVAGNTGWDSEYKNGIIYNDILPPWMYNWMSLQYCDTCDGGCSTTATMSFKVGDTKNKGLLNGDLQGWLGIDDTLSVYINNKLEHTQANVSGWTGNYDAIGWTGTFTVPNVGENSIIKIVGYNGGGPAGLGFTYLWNGLIFCLPSTLANFNNCAFEMNYKTLKEEGGMTYANGNMKNFPWETNWLNFSSDPGNFELITTISPSSNYSSWVYPPTKKIYYTMTQSNLVGNWSITNIKYSAAMSVSFWIIISETNSNWRNIFHVSNQNLNCCDTGTRIPGMWICPDNTQVYVEVSTSTSLISPQCSSYQIPLNTPTFITVIFNKQTMTLYANAVVQQTYTFSELLISANSTASFYMADPWYAFGGFKIKNFTLYNNVFNSSGVMTLYKKEMTISSKTEIPGDWVYAPTQNTYYTISQSNLIGNWSITNINSSATMSISFWINISEINYSNWRTIFHVSNQNVDCCDLGNRVPAMWICPANTQVFISSGVESDGNYGTCSSYQIPLNTPTFITIIFNSTTMTLYADSVVQQSYTYPSPLISANSNASFYMSDPWYAFGGFQIKNFTLYNKVLSPSDVSNLYQNEMN